MAALPIAALVLNPFLRLLTGKGRRKLQNVKIKSSRVNTKVIEQAIKRDIRQNGIFQETQESMVKRINKAVKVRFTARLRRPTPVDRFLNGFRQAMTPAVERAAKQVLATSIPFVPFDTGRLEGTGREFEGKSTKDRVEWAIAYGPAIDPETGTDYSLFAHFGQYERGPGTVAKGPEAGPLFLTRALDENRKLVIKRLQRNLDAYIRGL